MIRLTQSTFMTSQCKVVSKHGVDQWIIETLDKPWDGIDLSSLPQETKWFYGVRRYEIVCHFMEFYGRIFKRSNHYL